VRDHYRVSGDYFLLAKNLGVRAVRYFEKALRAGGNFAEYDPFKRVVGLNRRAIAELLPALTRYYRMDRSFFVNLLLTHELFHHLEERFFTRTDRYVAAQCAAPPKKSLRETAAFSFTEQLLSFPAEIIALIYLLEKPEGRTRVYQYRDFADGFPPVQQ
jgi:hypothetical protein